MGTFSNNYHSLLPFTAPLCMWAVGWVGYVKAFNKLTGSSN